MAIILGAQFNNALLEYFPLKPKAQRKLQEAHPTPAPEASAAVT